MRVSETNPQPPTAGNDLSSVCKHGGALSQHSPPRATPPPKKDRLNQVMPYGKPRLYRYCLGDKLDYRTHKGGSIESSGDKSYCFPAKRCKPACYGSPQASKTYVTD
ncbi:hypothetical protein E2C01_035152 [Portunus trituberculatus]|uniref:Uncharacterized protein n=1 Tax=Portunus trituberculatus TaxID=210409 RepID=A0A5B7F8Z0_PORTR|nr:hypothetical protein [Portunus trituberculatus]